VKYKTLIDRHENGRSKITLSRIIGGVVYECSILCDGGDRVSVSRLRSLLERAESRNGRVDHEV